MDKKTCLVFLITTFPSKIFLFALMCFDEFISLVLNLGPKPWNLRIFYMYLKPKREGNFKIKCKKFISLIWSMDWFRLSITYLTQVLRRRREGGGYFKCYQGETNLFLGLVCIHCREMMSLNVSDEKCSVIVWSWATGKWASIECLLIISLSLLMQKEGKHPLILFMTM